MTSGIKTGTIHIILSLSEGEDNELIK